MAISDNILDDVFRNTLENDEDIAEKIAILLVTPVKCRISAYFCE